MKTLNILAFASIAFLIGALCLFGVIVYFGGVSISSLFVTVLIFPAAFCFQTIIKLNELKEGLDFTDSEMRRLKYIVDRKRRFMLALILFYVLSAVFIIISLSISDVTPIFKLYSSIFSGGLLGVVFFSIIIIYRQINEVSDFKSMLTRRKNDKEKRKII